MTKAELEKYREAWHRLVALIRDDGWAITFQSTGQYRSALLREAVEPWTALADERERTVIEVQSGLMEHEGQTHIVVWGKGRGTTLQEVCRDIIAKDPSKGTYYKEHPNGGATDWGFTLRFLDA